MQVVFVYVAIICVAFIFVTNRGRKKQQVQQATMRNALVVGVEARTIGGIVGEVVEVTDEHVILETTPGVRLKLVKSAVAGILQPAVEEADEAETDEDPESGPDHEAEPDAALELEPQDAAVGDESAEEAEPAEPELSKK